MGRVLKVHQAPSPASVGLGVLESWTLNRWALTSHDQFRGWRNVSLI